MDWGAQILVHAVVVGSRHDDPGSVDASNVFEKARTVEPQRSALATVSGGSARRFQCGRWWLG